MDVNELIELGEEIRTESYAFIEIVGLFMGGVLILGVLLCIAYGVSRLTHHSILKTGYENTPKTGTYREFKDYLRKGGEFTAPEGKIESILIRERIAYGILAVAGVLGGIAYPYFVLIKFEGMQEEEKELAVDWVTEHAYPYIQSLPTEKIYLADVQSDTSGHDDALSYENGQYLPGFGDNATEDGPFNLLDLMEEKQDRQAVTVKYETLGEEYVVEGNFVLSKTLPEDAQPYLEYHLLEENLGYSFTPGMYDTVLYLPEDYDL